MSCCCLCYHIGQLSDKNYLSHIVQQVAVHGFSNDAAVPAAEILEVKSTEDNGDKLVEESASSSSSPSIMEGLTISSFMSEVIDLIK
jgi:hypothetical protein